MKKLLKKFLIFTACIAFIVGGFVIVNNGTVKNVYADEPTRQTSEKIADVYLIAGQSNASGTSLIANGIGPCYAQQENNSYEDSSIIYENVFYNHLVHPTTKGEGYVISDFEPVKQGLGCSRSHIGPELGMAKYLDPIYAQKENTDAIIIKVAAGGTSLINHYDNVNLNIEEIEENDYAGATYGTWYPESLWNVFHEDGSKVDLMATQFYRHPTGHLYRELILFITNNYQWLQDKGYTKINFKALCWMQGERDRGNEAEYKDVFSAFVSDVRSRLTELTGEDYSKFPVVSGEISKTFFHTNQVDVNEKFIAMQHEILYKLNHTYVIPTKDFRLHDYDNDGNDVTLGSDGSHWNYEDMVDIGYLFGEKAYNASMDDRWVYLKSTAKRNDHIDKTNLENVKIDLDEFNKSGKLSFTCDLKKLYNITSLTADNVDLMPYLIEQVCGNYRTYTVDGVAVDNTEDLTVEAFFTNADTYNVSVSIAQDGSGYGNKIYTYDKKAYANAGYYEFEAHPAQDGRVYSVTINGIEVQGAKNNKTIVIDNIFDYLNGENEFKIIVQYSPIPPKRIEASGYVSTYEVGEAFSTEGLVIKFLDELDNETVLGESEYTVDSSRFDSSKTGTYLITITSGEYTCSYTVKVVAPVLEIENPKTTFILGEAFSIGEGKVYIVSKAGRRELSDSEYTVNTLLFSPNYASTYDISVSGQGASGTYKVKVVVPDAIVVENAKTEFSGEEFSTGDIVVKAIVNGEEIVLDESACNVSSKDFVQNKSGTYTIKVSAAGKNVTYDVTVTVASAGGGCGANAMDIIGLVAGLCALAFAFRKAK